MTLINQNSSVTHNGNGVTTLWPYTFIIPDAESVRVGLFDIASGALTELVESDYSITGLGDDAGGEVTYPLIGSPIASSKRLVIWREVAYTQDTELTNQTPFYPEVLEDQLDRLVMQIQQLAAESGRSIKVTLGSTLDPDEFVEQLQQGAADAAASAAAAAASQVAVGLMEDNVEAIQASITLPAVPVALNMLRRNAGNTAYENRTPAQVLADVNGFGVVRRQVFTTSGTYTPHANMLYCIVESIGGGGGGGGVVGAASGGASGGSGGAGGYTVSILARASVTPSQTVTIGAGGAGGSGVSGGNGSATTFGALNTANGGSGGTVGNAATVSTGVAGAGAPAASTGGQLYGGNSGQSGYAAAGGITVALGGASGAGSVLGGGGLGTLNAGAGAGTAPGAGGGAAAAFNNVTNRAGGSGSAGLVIVTEFCSQ